MRRTDVVDRLLQNAESIRHFGVAALYLYGSYSRDEAGPDSDVDLFFDRDLTQNIGLLELIRLQRLLHEILGTEVDVGTRTSLHPVLKDDIERSALRVF